MNNQDQNHGFSLKDIQFFSAGLANAVYHGQFSTLDEAAIALRASMNEHADEFVSACLQHAKFHARESK